MKLDQALGIAALVACFVAGLDRGVGETVVTSIRDRGGGDHRCRRGAMSHRAAPDVENRSKHPATF